MLWARLALAIFGYAWPAYQTFKVIELKGSDDLRKWGKYWMIIGFYTALSPVLDTLLFWIPMYYELRLAAAIYLWYPQLKGAEQVYERWIQPLVLQYEPVIDSKLAQSKAQLGDLLSSNFSRLVQLAQAKMAALLQQAQLKAGPPMGGQKAD